MDKGAEAQHVLIAGGGIAGLTAAMALQRAGIESTVFEAWSGNAAGAGAFLTVAVNGLAALRAIGVDEAVMAAGFPTASIELRSGSGKRLGEVPVGGALADGTVAHTIRRDDLYRVLCGEARRRGIRVDHGRRLVDAETTGDGRVVARFEDDSSVSGTLLVGADGIHSRTRRIVDPSAPAPRYVGLVNVGGFSRATVRGARPGRYVMTFGKRAFFGYVVSPAGEVWWFANPPHRAELTREEIAAPPEEWKERLVDLFEDDCGPAREIIEKTETLAVTNQHDLPRVRRWWRGPMILIGDAAHAASPSSGQGASLAIEDAVTLAQCLRDLPDRASAFATFEKLRRPRVERIVAWGARTNQSKMPGPVGRIVRDLLLPVILTRTAEAQRWMFDHRIDWNQPCTAAR